MEIQHASPHLQENAVWCCQGDVESSPSSCSHRFKTCTDVLQDLLKGSVNLSPHLSSTAAEQLQPVDPDSDSASGNPQTCLFLKAALTRSLQCCFPAVHFIFCFFFSSLNLLQWICYFHFTIQLCPFDASFKFLLFLFC